MCCCDGWGAICASYAAQSDVLLISATWCSEWMREEGAHVAYSILSYIDSILENALCTGLSGSWCSIVGDDLVRCGFDDVFGVEVEEFFGLLPLIAVPLVVPIFGAGCFVGVFVGMRLVGMDSGCSGGNGGDE
jgi:hypothetical protein